MYNPSDNVLQKKIKKYIPTIIIYDSLNFLVTKELLEINLDNFYKNVIWHGASDHHYEWNRTICNRFSY